MEPDESVRKKLDTPRRGAASVTIHVAASSIFFQFIGRKLNFIGARDDPGRSGRAPKNSTRGHAARMMPQTRDRLS